MSKWIVYEMNDCDWYVARTPDEAMEAMRENLGYESVDDLKEDAMFEAEPEALSDEDLDRLKFCVDECRSGPKITFREQLQKMIADEKGLPGFFASTEW